jgi:hypothetical protein
MQAQGPLQAKATGGPRCRQSRSVHQCQKNFSPIGAIPTQGLLTRFMAGRFNFFSCFVFTLQFFLQDFEP